MDEADVDGMMCRKTTARNDEYAEPDSPRAEVTLPVIVVADCIAGVVLRLFGCALRSSGGTVESSTLLSLRLCAMRRSYPPSTKPEPPPKPGS